MKMIKHLKRVSTVVFVCFGMYCGTKAYNNDIHDTINMMGGVVILYITIIVNELWSGENW